MAILLVVACHCGMAWFAGGFIGVDVFFVISGYLITGLLAKEYRETSRIDLPAFFARRARRLIPACALVLIATAIAATMMLAPQEIEETAHATMAAAFYASNMFFEHAAADYFGPAVERNPLLHTWSLGVEEQFYLVWPCLMWVACRGGGRRRVWLLGVLAAGSFACGLYATRLVPLFAFYSLPARAWEFAAGGLLALAPVPTDPARHTPWAIGGGVVGMLTILGTAVWVNRRCGLSRLDRRTSRRGDAGGPARGHNSAASRHERGARHRSVAICRRAILFLVSLALAVHRVRCDLISEHYRVSEDRLQPSHRC